MMFMIKSTVCFVVIYAVYKIFLAKENAPVFKRFFLLFGLLFSIVVPCLEISIKAPIQEAINPIAIQHQIGEIYAIQTDTLSGAGYHTLIVWLLYAIYCICSVTMLIRYVMNIIRLINTGKNSPQ